MVLGILCTNPYNLNIGESLKHAWHRGIVFLGTCQRKCNMRLAQDCSRFGSCFLPEKVPCGVKNRILGKILFRQLRCSLFSSACYFDKRLRRFCKSTFSTFTYTFQRLNNKVADQTAHLRPASVQAGLRHC